MFLDLLFPRQSLDFLSRLSVLPLSPFISPFEGRVSVYSYHYLSPLIQLIKYQFVTDFIPDLARLVSLRFRSDYPRLLDYWHHHHFLLTPIPLAPYRQNWRGFNQSELLGRSIAQNLKLDYSDQILVRTRHTLPQVSLSTSHRLTNLKSSFLLADTRLVRQHNSLVLFDDVFTTGATLISAARPLFYPPKPLGRRSFAKSAWRRQAPTIRLWAFTLAA